MRRPLLARLSAGILVLAPVAASGLGAGCHRAPPASDGAGTPVAAGTGSALTVATGAGRRSATGAKSGERIDIPAGRSLIGSLPGDEGRDPTTEPLATTIDVGGFAIDALPYPGTPGQPPMIGVSQAEAQKLCGERGGRLCGEVEWERACRGAGGDAFGSGPSWDPTCGQTPGACTSGFGARDMGATLEEWTASPAEIATLPGRPKIPRVAVRGATAASPTSAHRCAARKAVDAHAGKSRALGFRCCYGGQVPAPLPAIDWQPGFRKGALEGAQLAGVLALFPELARVRTGAKLFAAAELAPVFEKSAPGDGVTITSDPIEWSPEPGADLLVFAGKSKGGSFIVALHKLPQGKLRLASSLVFANDQVPIALAYEPNLRREIRWSTSWGAHGEGGAITCRDDHRVVIVQR